MTSTPDPFTPVFKGMFAAAFESLDRFRGLPVLRAEDAIPESEES